MSIRKANMEGKEYELSEVDPLNSVEKWNEYQMSNGDLLKVKLVLTRIFTSMDNLPNGNHPYNIDYQAVTVIIRADELKQGV